MKKPIVYILTTFLIFIIPVFAFSSTAHEYGESVNELNYFLSVLPGEDFVWTQQERQHWWKLVMEYDPNGWYDVEVPYDESLSVISSEDAIQLAETVVFNNIIMPEDVRANATFGCSRSASVTMPPYWTVNFYIKDGNQYVSCGWAFVSYTGQIMDESYGYGLHAVTNSGDEDSLITPFQSIGFVPFYMLSIEEKAEFSAEWYEKAQNYCSENPMYRGIFYYETLRIYGMPGNDAISQDEAYETAVNVLSTLVADDWVERSTPYYYYDVTDDNKPLWKVLFTTLGNMKVNDVLCWIVSLDANTGEIIDVKSNDASGIFYENLR